MPPVRSLGQIDEPSPVATDDEQGDQDPSFRIGEHPANLRAILVHMIEETSRHNGHADIIRELLDGATGHSQPPGLPRHLRRLANEAGGRGRPVSPISRAGDR